MAEPSSVRQPPTPRDGPASLWRWLWFHCAGFALSEYRGFFVGLAACLLAAGYFLTTNVSLRAALVQAVTGEESAKTKQDSAGGEKTSEQLRNNLARMEADNLEVRRQLENKEHERARLQRQLENREQDLASLQRQLKDKDQEVEKLQNQVGELAAAKSRVAPAELTGVNEWLSSLRLPSLGSPEAEVVRNPRAREMPLGQPSYAFELASGLGSAHVAFLDRKVSQVKIVGRSVSSNDFASLRGTPDKLYDAVANACEQRKTDIVTAASRAIGKAPFPRPWSPNEAHPSLLGVLETSDAFMEEDAMEIKSGTVSVLAAIRFYGVLKNNDKRPSGTVIGRTRDHTLLNGFGCEVLVWATTMPLR